MPSCKVLALVLALYTLFVFAPALGFLYFRDSLPFKFSDPKKPIESNPIEETGESTTVDEFVNLAKPSQMPIARDKFFNKENSKKGWFEGVGTDTKIVRISDSVKDPKNTREFLFTNDTWVLCLRKTATDDQGNQIDVSSINVNMGQLPNTSYEVLSKRFKEVPIEERMEELQGYKTGEAVHYGVDNSQSETPSLYWIIMFKDSCREFTTDIKDFYE